ncbi:MAG: hypothetical protein JO007_02070 [Alphaproteobacteria bacterium]|nr:hypothetical protein [Alphaproteobacteria bacterium]
MKPTIRDATPQRSLSPDQTEIDRDLANYTEWLVFATFVLGVIGLAQAIVLYKSVYVADKTATAAHRANLLTAEIFNAQRHPFLEVIIEKSPNYDFEWAEMQGKTRVKIIIKNHGLTPARVVREDILMLSPSHSHPRSLIKAMADLISDDVKNIVQEDMTWGIIFPQVNDWWHFQELQIDVSGISTDGWVSLNILSCLWYESMGGRGPIYETARSWRMIQRADRITDRFTIGRNVANTTLDIIQNRQPCSEREVPEKEIHRL